MARVTFAVGLFGVCSIQAAMAPLCRHPRLPSPSPKINYIYLSQAYLNMSVFCDVYTYGLYLWPWVGCMYVMTFHVTFLSVTHHVCTYVRIYVLCENRSSIESLTLMCLVIIHLCAQCTFSTINFVCVLSWLVEPPSLRISREPSGTLYVNQSVTLTCTATLSKHVDTSVTVVVTWTGPRGFLSNNTTAPINALQTTDSGSYTCSAIARPDVPSTFVAASTNTTSVVNIMVVGKTQCTQSHSE